MWTEDETERLYKGFTNLEEWRCFCQDIMIIYQGFVQKRLATVSIRVNNPNIWGLIVGGVTFVWEGSTRYP